MNGVDLECVVVILVKCDLNLLLKSTVLSITLA